MTKPRVKIKHPKRRGEWAEMRFMAMAAENGLEVTKPFGEMARYDFIVEHEGKFARVQVKSTIRRHLAGAMPVPCGAGGIRTGATSSISWLYI